MSAKPSKYLSSNFEWMVNQLKPEQGVNELLQHLIDNPETVFVFPSELNHFDHFELIVKMAETNNPELFINLYKVIQHPSFLDPDTSIVLGQYADMLTRMKRTRLSDWIRKLCRSHGHHLGITIRYW